MATIALSSSANPSIFNQPVSFTAKVTSGASTPSGTVTFYDGATALAVGTLIGGQATFSLSSLAIGSHSIIAAYSGDGNFNGNTSQLSISWCTTSRWAAPPWGVRGTRSCHRSTPMWTSVWKQGRTIPAQFRVCDVNGVSVASAGVGSSFFLTQIISGTLTNINETISSTNPDTVSRVDL